MKCALTVYTCYHRLKDMDFSRNKDIQPELWPEYKFLKNEHPCLVFPVKLITGGRVVTMHFHALTHNYNARESK